MHETATINAHAIGLRPIPLNDNASAKLPLTRRIRIFFAPPTDIETHPDLRSRRQKLYDASLFVVLGIIVVPWLCIVAAMWLTLTLLGMGKLKAF